ncbi:MAG: trigger factor family protein, partial [bacterium]
MNYEKKQISKTQVDILIDISKEDLKKEYDNQVKKLSKNVEIKGFRRGTVPVNIAEPTVGVQAQQNALEELLQKYALEILQKENILPAAQLSYEIESVSIDKGAKIKAIVPVVPPFNVPEISKIKVKKESSEVTSSDVDNLIKHLWTEHRDKAKNKDDKWVEGLSKKLGFKSKSIKDLRKELEDSIKREKERIVIQKYQSDILAKAIELS